MSNKRSNFKYFLDWISDNWLGIFFVFCILAGISNGVSLCTSKAEARCVTHIVEQGQTLGKISKQYYGDRNHWQDIKWQNNLKRNRLKVGQELGIYIPDEDDWKIACTLLIHLRLDQLGITRPAYTTDGIIDGVIDMNMVDPDPIRALEYCRWATATAEQESMYQFAVGGAGEIGMYQFKLNTVRLTGRWYNNLYLQGDDTRLVKLLLNPQIATKIFLLHYIELHKRYKSLWIAWKRYNNGSEAAAYASKAMKRYWKIRQLQPIKCRPYN